MALNFKRFSLKWFFHAVVVKALVTTGFFLKGIAANKKPSSQELIYVFPIEQEECMGMPLKGPISNCAKNPLTVKRKIDDGFIAPDRAGFKTWIEKYAPNDHRVAENCWDKPNAWGDFYSEGAIMHQEKIYIPGNLEDYHVTTTHNANENYREGRRVLGEGDISFPPSLGLQNLASAVHSFYDNISQEFSFVTFSFKEPTYAFGTLIFSSINESAIEFTLDCAPREIIEIFTPHYCKEDGQWGFIGVISQRPFNQIQIKKNTSFTAPYCLGGVVIYTKKKDQNMINAFSNKNIQNNPDRTESYDAMDGDQADKIEAITGQKGQEVPEFEMHTVTALVDSSMWDSETDSIGPMALASRPSAQSRKARLLAQNFSSIGPKQDTSIDFYALAQNHEALTHRSGKIDLVVRPFGSTFHGMQTKGTISGCMLGMRYKEKNYSVQLLGSFESQKAKLPEDVARRKTNQVYGGVGASVGDIEDFAAVSYHFIGSVGNSRTARKTFALSPALSLAKGRSGVYTQSHVVSLARSLPFSSEVNFIPTVTFTLRKTKEKGYTENDAGAFAIAYQPQKMKFFRQELAFRFEMKSPGLSIQATPFVYAIQGPRELNRDASFVINPSPYTLARTGKTKVFTGLTLTTKMALQRSLFFKIQAKGEFSSKAHMFTALLELQKVF